jgi:hypothetical protein
MQATRLFPFDVSQLLTRVFIHSRLFAYAVIALSFLCAPGLIPQAMAQKAPARNATSPDTVARFQSFLESPPVIDQIIFRVKRAAPLPIEVNQGEEIYVARFQNNAFIIRQLASLSEAPLGTNTPTAYQPRLISLGRFGNYYWLACADNFQETTATEPLDTPNPVRTATLKQYDTILGSVLNLGIANVDVGTLKWKGTTFETMSNADKPVRVKGTLTLSGDAPSQLRLSYDNYNWLVSYDYSIPMKPGYLPSGWTTRVFNEQGRAIPNVEVQILSCRLGHRPSKNRNDFLPKNVPFLDQIKHKSIYTNGFQYLVTPNGLVKPTPSPAQPIFPSLNQ